MIVNNGSPQYHMSLDGQHSFFDQYGCRAVLVWLSSRMFRSGHKLILQVIACMAAVLLLTHSLPQRASDVALGRGYSDWIGWARGKASEAVGDASEAAGLRVVVFGASDIATLPDTKKGDMAWPEVMCEEVGDFGSLYLINYMASAIYFWVWLGLTRYKTLSVGMYDIHLVGAETADTVTIFQQPLRRCSGRASTSFAQGQGRFTRPRLLILSGSLSCAMARA